MKQVLFIGPEFMGIYKDIIVEFHKQNMDVDFVSERSLAEDPYNVRGYKGTTPGILNKEDAFYKSNENYWNQLLLSEKYNKTYDILFILDGQGIHPCIFDILRSRNERLLAVNYLFDTTKGVYRFDKHFYLYDRVFTFDVEESKKYNVRLLPIYWVEDSTISTDTDDHYTFFGLGRYNRLRSALFAELRKYSQQNRMQYYLKLQGEKITLFLAKWAIRTILGKNSSHIRIADYYSKDFILNPVPTKEYRRLSYVSDIIVDTNASHQDGLTARFMWALGMKKKIITTNKAARLYDFYSSEQIFIVEDLKNFVDTAPFASFVNNPFEISEDMQKKIEQYRIDNWLSQIIL